VASWTISSFSLRRRSRSSTCPISITDCTGRAIQRPWQQARSPQLHRLRVRMFLSGTRGARRWRRAPARPPLANEALRASASACVACVSSCFSERGECSRRFACVRRCAWLDRPLRRRLRARQTSERCYSQLAVRNKRARSISAHILFSYTTRAHRRET
jgi:hypothetical protein